MCGPLASTVGVSVACDLSSDPFRWEAGLTSQSLSCIYSVVPREDYLGTLEPPEGLGRNESHTEAGRTVRALAGDQMRKG